MMNEMYPFFFSTLVKKHSDTSVKMTKVVLALTVVNVCLTAVNVGLAFANMVIVKIFARTLAGVRDADD